MLLHWKSQKPQPAGFSLPEVLIACVIFVLVTAGAIEGYVQMNRMATWSTWSVAAQSIASEGLEAARGAQWHEMGGLDQWGAHTNADGTWWAYVTNCYLDVPSSGAQIPVTLSITVSSISSSPPIRMIRSDCIWTYPVTGQLATNSMITLRAPDQ